MKKLLYILFLLIALNIYAENQMNQMTFMSGEFGGSEYGCAMASLDFNGDGYQDLVVASQAWNPSMVYNDQNRWGKLYFYWGGPGFDNIADFVIEGTYVNQLGNSYGGMDLYNARDVNHDGIDDLVVSQRSPSYNNQVAVYFGRSVPQTSPDFQITLPYPEVDWITIIPLGDINGDNHADISIIQYTSSVVKTYIWDDITVQPRLAWQTSNIYCRSTFSGVGDVNGDGIDDCYQFIPINNTGYIHNRMCIHFGDNNIPFSDSLDICDDTNAYTTEYGSPVGDFNGDGTDDFVAYNNHLWLGGSNLTAQWDVALSAEYGFDYGFSETGTGYPFVHGDLNGDGFEDIISSNSIYGGHSGVLTLWMGRSQMNGTVDLIMPSPNDYPYRNFGYSKVTGDFNADGFCDIAVGAPWFDLNDHWDTGRVYVYAGNADLHDTTVANDDDVTQLIEQDWKLDVYPNPAINNHTTLNVKFSGESYLSIANLTLEIFNVKGQKLYSQAITSAQIKADSVNITPGSLPKGMLIIKASHAGKLLTATKVIIL